MTISTFYFTLTAAVALVTIGALLSMRSKRTPEATPEPEPLEEAEQAPPDPPSLVIGRYYFAGTETVDGLTFWYVFRLSDASTPGRTDYCFMIRPRANAEALVKLFDDYRDSELAKEAK